jgi:hypothetical protein
VTNETNTAPAIVRITRRTRNLGYAWTTQTGA